MSNLTSYGKAPLKIFYYICTFFYYLLPFLCLMPIFKWFFVFWFWFVCLCVFDLNFLIWSISLLVCIKLNLPVLLFVVCLYFTCSFCLPYVCLFVCLSVCLFVCFMMSGRNAHLRVSFASLFVLENCKSFTFTVFSRLKRTGSECQIQKAEM